MLNVNEYFEGKVKSIAYQTEYPPSFRRCDVEGRIRFQYGRERDDDCNYRGLGNYI